MLLYTQAMKQLGCSVLCHLDRHNFILLKGSKSDWYKLSYFAVVSLYFLTCISAI